jgi:hypothetical protein
MTEKATGELLLAKLPEVELTSSFTLARLEDEVISKVVVEGLAVASAELSREVIGNVESIDNANSNTDAEIPVVRIYLLTLIWALRPNTLCSTFIFLFLVFVLNIAILVTL